MKNKIFGSGLMRVLEKQGIPKLTTRFMATTCLSAALALSSVSASYAALSNTATATGTPAAGTLTNPTDTVNIPVQLAAPGYTVVKSVVSTTTSAGARPTLTDGGDTITYSYVVDNTGNVSLNTVVITDPGVKFNGGPANPLTTGPILASGDTDNDNILDTNEVWTYTATYVLTQGNVGRRRSRRCRQYGIGNSQEPARRQCYANARRLDADRDNDNSGLACAHH
jgi:hypothetical protein